MPPNPWKTLSSRPIYANRWMRVREDLAQMPDGRQTIYGVVTFGPCVGILPFVDADHVILVRQYRYVQDENQRWEMPTGGVHAGEAIEDAAQRELIEEAGYRAGRLMRLPAFYTSKSVCDETAYIFVAHDLEPATLPPDDTEELERGVFSFADVLQMVLRGEIRDSMTIIAVLLAARQR